MVDKGDGDWAGLVERAFPPFLFEIICFMFE